MNEEELYKTVKRLVSKNQYYYQVKNKEDRQSIINDTYIYVWNKVNKGELDMDEQEGYVFIAGRNNCLNYLRKKRKHDKRTVSIDEPTDDDKTIDIPNPPNTYDYEIDEKINKILSLMDNDDEIEFLKMRLSGYTLEEIAELKNMDNEQIYRLNKQLKYHIRKRYDTGDLTGKLTGKTLYQVYDIETGEIIYQTKNKRTIETVGIARRMINYYVENEIVFNKKYKIKTIKV